VRAERISENVRIFDFALDASEVGAIDALNLDLRAGSDPEAFNADSYRVDVSAQ
jgi:diketogulonate reductase-like aldo/keto reductase